MGRHRNRDEGAVPSKQARALVGGSGQPPKTADHRVVDDMEQRRELGWLSRQVRVVVVGDREIDVHRLFEQQAAHAGEAGLLVRVCAERKRKVRVDCRVLGARMIREWRRSWISWNRCCGFRC